MGHMIVLLYFVSFAVGFSCLLLGTLTYLRNRLAPLKFFLLFALALTLILIEQMVTAYGIVNAAGSEALATVMRFVSAVGCSLVIYTFSRLVMSIGHSTIGKKVLVGIIVWAAMPLVLSVVFSSTGLRVLMWIANGLFYANVIRNIVLLTLRLDRLPAGDVRKSVTCLLIASLLLFPVLVLDNVVERLPGIGERFPFGLFSVFALYLAFSIISLVFFVRLNRAQSAGNAPEQSEKSPEPSVLDRCGATQREREIAYLLTLGNSYRAIAEQLCISLPTVKTHVCNLYEKMGVSNKIELLHLMQNHPKG